MNRLYGLIGFPLGHSFSARYFTEKFQRENLSGYEYRNFPLESIRELPAMLENHPGLLGFNVTIPYKLITITAGVFSLNLPMFVLASVVSRGLRFFLFAWLIWRYGAPIKVFIDKYFNILAIAFTVLLIGSFVAVKYLIQ